VEKSSATLRKQAIVPVGVAVLAVVLWTAFGSAMLPLAQRTDFLNLYTGASLALHGHFRQLYDYSLQSAVSRSLMPDVISIFPFVRPPFYALALSPLALLPFKQAFAVWISLQIVLLLACWWWAWRTFGPDALVWTSMFLPTALGIASGQDCVVTLAICCAAWAAYRRKLETVAGVLLALTLFKFHLFLLVPLALLVRRRWRMFAGYSAAGSALAILSLLLCGWQGVRAYAALLTRKDLATLAPSPERMLGVNALLANLRIDSLPVTALLAGAVIFLVVRSARFHQDDWRWFWAAVAGSLLISPHTYPYDGAVLLIPGLLAVFQGDTPTLRILGATILLPLLYGLNLAGPPYSALPGLALLAFLAALAGALPLRVSRNVNPLDTGQLVQSGPSA